MQPNRERQTPTSTGTIQLLVTKVGHLAPVKEASPVLTSTTATLISCPEISISSRRSASRLPGSHLLADP